MRGNLGPWIAVAGAFVGAGLFLGLRAREQQTQRSAPAAPAAPAPPRDPESVQRDIATAFEARRTEWRRACWEPIVAKAPAPPLSRHSISISIDPAGKEVLRAINDVRGDTRLDVATCLREQAFVPIQITPPGEPRSTTIEIQFP